MHIDIHIPRPMLTLLTIAAISGWAVALTQGGKAQIVTPSGVEGATVTAQAITDASDVQEPIAESIQHVQADNITTTQVPQETPHEHVEEQEDVGTPEQKEAQRKVEQLREGQEVLRAKEDIIRYQLEKLQDERDRLGENADPALLKQIYTSTRLLNEFLQDSARADRFLASALNQMYEAEAKAIAQAMGPTQNLAHLSLLWPVEPALGISAYFNDQGYERRFKMRHRAIDIPVEQGSNVRAAAGGVVTEVIDHGLGENYIVIAHPGGYSTLYMHLLPNFRVKPGDRVVAGDVIASSSGLPGAPGSGFSTGPHLHFGVYVNGAAVDPLQFLPAAAGVSEA